MTLVSTLVLSGCLNIYSPLDSPSGDQQLLSAGRSCFDRGDYACAKTEFSKLSSSNADTEAAENAFVILAQNGAGSGVFIKVFGTGTSNVGPAFNTFASYFPNASATLRASIFTAYEQVQNMTPNTPLRGLVRFASASAFLAEVLAEGAAIPGTIKQLDIAAQPSSCVSAGVIACAAGGACSGTGATGSFISGPGKYSTAGLDDYLPTSSNPSAPSSAAIAGTTPTFDMISGAVTSIANALATNELGGSGNFGGTSASFASSLLSSQFVLNTSPTDSPCFRYGMLSLGLGSP